MHLLKAAAGPQATAAARSFVCVCTANSSLDLDSTTDEGSAFLSQTSADWARTRSWRRCPGALHLAAGLRASASFRNPRGRPQLFRLGGGRCRLGGVWAPAEALPDHLLHAELSFRLAVESFRPGPPGSAVPSAFFQTSTCSLAIRA